MTRSLLMVIAAIISSGTAVASTQDNRLDVSTYQDSLKDYSKTHANSWEYWGLTKEDWEKYESIKQKSPWSVWKNEATPLAILSHYSSSLVEKRRYARLAAELDQWRENAVLEWQAIYNKEREIVFAKNAASLNARKPILANIRATDRIVYFVRAGDCDARCNAVTSRLLTTSARIDIYVLGATTETDIYAWATGAKIPIDRVHVKQITLNFENSYLRVVTTTPATLLELPVAYVQTKDDFKPVIFQ